MYMIWIPVDPKFTAEAGGAFSLPMVVKVPDDADTLSTLRSLADANWVDVIELTTQPDRLRVDMWVDDEALLTEAPIPNFIASAVRARFLGVRSGTVFGSAVICLSDPAGNTTGWANVPKLAELVFAAASHISTLLNAPVRERTPPEPLTVAQRYDDWVNR